MCSVTILLSMDQKDLKQFSPDSPGVYFFRSGKNRRSKALYIGKATSLRDRVRSYFTADVLSARGPRIAAMLREAKSVDVEPTDSVLEALILEAKYIKRYQPIYNVEERDDKSFNYVVVTREAFPRVLVVRGREMGRDPKVKKMKIQGVFGPFPHGGELRSALKIIRRLFPYRDRCMPESGKPCFDRQIGLCPGVCTGEIRAREYGKTIRNLKLFFDGKKKKIAAHLRRDMKVLGRTHEFERAARVRNTLFALDHVRDVSLLKRERGGVTEPSSRIEAYDIAHISGAYTVGAMTVWEGGELVRSGYRLFKIRGERGADDTGNLREVLERRMGHSEWPLPDVIVLDGGVGQVNVARKVLAERGFDIAIVGVVKDSRHQAAKLVGNVMALGGRREAAVLANAEAHRMALAYHRKLRSRLSSSR